MNKTPVSKQDLQRIVDIFSYLSIPTAYNSGVRVEFYLLNDTTNNINLRGQLLLWLIQCFFDPILIIFSDFLAFLVFLVGITFNNFPQCNRFFAFHRFWILLLEVTICQIFKFRIIDPIDCFQIMMVICYTHNNNHGESSNSISQQKIRKRLSFEVCTVFVFIQPEFFVRFFNFLDDFFDFLGLSSSIPRNFHFPCRVKRFLSKNSYFKCYNSKMKEWTKTLSWNISFAGIYKNHKITIFTYRRIRCTHIFRFNFLNFVIFNIFRFSNSGK